MTSAPQWPPRPAGSSVSGSLRTEDGGQTQSRQAALPSTPSPVVKGYPDLPGITAFCLEALDGALELVRADGGEVAALNAAGTAMVTRARQASARHRAIRSRCRHSRPTMPPTPSIAR